VISISYKWNVILFQREHPFQDLITLRLAYRSHAEADRGVTTGIPRIVSVRIEVPGAISEYAYLLYAVTIPVAYDGDITSHAEANRGVNTGIPRIVSVRIEGPDAFSEDAYLGYAVTIPVAYDGISPAIP